MTLEPSIDRTQTATPAVMIHSDTSSRRCCQQKETTFSFIGLRDSAHGRRLSRPRPRSGDRASQAFARPGRPKQVIWLIIKRCFPEVFGRGPRSEPQKSFDGEEDYRHKKRRQQVGRLAVLYVQHAKSGCGYQHAAHNGHFAYERV